MLIDNKYDIGDEVFLKTDTDQYPRMIISIRVNKYDLVYELTCGTVTSYHYDFEMSKEKNYTKA